MLPVPGHRGGRTVQREFLSCLFIRVLEISWGVRITQVCLCVNVQLCLISKTAVMLGQGRILADQLSLFIMQETPSEGIFLNGGLVLKHISKS